MTVFLYTSNFNHVAYPKICMTCCMYSLIHLYANIRAWVSMQPKSSLKEDKYSVTKNLLKGNFMQKITIYNLLNIFDSVFIVKREYDYIFTIFCPLNMQIMQFSTIFHIFCLSKLTLVPLNYQ